MYFQENRPIKDKTNQVINIDLTRNWTVFLIKF